MIFTPDIEMTTYEFPERELYFYDGLMGLYHKAAEIAFPEADLENANFDAREINISPLVQEWLFHFYETQGYTKYDTNMFLCQLGPKVNEELTGYEFEVSEDFVRERRN